MAHIANRSRFRVTVKNKPDLTQHFSFSKVAAVEAYMKELRAQGYKPRAEQLDESWLVRIRERGHKPLEATFESEAAATQFIEKTSEERKRGLFIDYTAALKVTFADILVRYLLEETSRKKSGEVLAYVLEGWLEDSGPRGVELLAQYREELRARGARCASPNSKCANPARNSPGFTSAWQRSPRSTSRASSTSALKSSQRERLTGKSTDSRPSSRWH